MSTTGVECPSCGGPPRDVPVDPNATVSCPWCGSTYQVIAAEKALAQLREEVGDWLRKTTGVSATGGSSAVDVATRSFLFNDRILPGIRRDVRRALDEDIGDVYGSPILVPPLLQHLPGFTGEDAVLITMREAVLGLRQLRARLETPDVTGFATSAADNLCLTKLCTEIDRTLLASNAACALSGGIRTGAPIVHTNLEALSQRASESAIDGAVDPTWAALSRATRVRCESVIAAVDALSGSPPDVGRLTQSADKLDETAQWLLTSDTRDFRTALASTGINRDATAIRVLAAVGQALAGSQLRILDVAESLTPLAPLLEKTRRSVDAAALVYHWTLALRAIRQEVGVCAVSDISWVNQRVEAVRGNNERASQVEVMLVPFWAMPAHHAKAEGFIFVSGKQYEGIALVPASTDESGTILVETHEPMASLVQQAISTGSRATLPLEPPSVGPDAARQSAKTVLKGRNLKNVSLGDSRLLYVPLALIKLESSSGTRYATVGPTGVLPYDANEVAKYARLLHEAARKSAG